ncbi:MAG: ribosome biogenesis factor YjgA [Desulfobacterales bacterium]
MEKSRTQIKREMEALQALGEELIYLPLETLIGMGLPPDLLEALRFAQGVSKRGARKRQLQFIGRLMREVDPVPIRRLLAERHRHSSLDARAFKTAEAWRDLLVSGSDAPFLEVRERFPQADHRHLDRLVRNARKAGGSAATGRLLFRFLISLFSPPAAAADAAGQTAEDAPD